MATTPGYTRIRQFSDSMREAFTRIPSELRQQAELVSAGEGPVVLRLAFTPPFDARSLLGFLAPRAIPGVEEVTDRRHRRVVRTGRTTRVMALDVAPDAASILLRLYVNDLAEHEALVQLARALFALEAEPAAIDDVLAADRGLKPLVLKRPGFGGAGGGRWIRDGGSGRARPADLGERSDDAGGPAG